MNSNQEVLDISEKREELWPVDRVTHRKRFQQRVKDQLRIMEECGRDEELRDGIAPTPERVTRMWLDELTVGYSIDVESLFKLFPDEGYKGQVVVRDIPFVSVCEHHMLPIIGSCHIGYFPDEWVIGLSKLPRIVNAFARRLQIQERATQQIVDSIEEHLKPKGTICLVSAEHSCTTIRGVQAPGTKTLTCSLTGRYRDKEEQAKEEFLSMIGHDGGV